jgi:diguanylate cyclase (GGDEF)-like protein
MSILLVDDSRVVRLMLAEILNEAGYPDIDPAESVPAAFARLGMDSGTPATDVDLILMDTAMPGMDGITAIRHILAVPALQDTPIIMVTGSVSPTDLPEAFEAGAMDYISKPVHKPEFLARVRSALRLKSEIDQRKARERDLIQALNQLETANGLLHHAAITDALTGVANRREFDRVLAEEWGRASRDGTSLAVLMIDIDFFKGYNDAYGHQGGDSCLQTVARTLQGCVHRPVDLVARYGGEEFSVILPGTKLSDAKTVAYRVRAHVASEEIPHMTSQISSFVTVSVGVAAIVPRLGIEAQSLVASADKALYQAKQEGRNRVREAAEVPV